MVNVTLQKSSQYRRTKCNTGIIPNTRMVVFMAVLVILCSCYDRSGFFSEKINSNLRYFMFYYFCAVCVRFVNNWLACIRMAYEIRAMLFSPLDVSPVVPSLFAPGPIRSHRTLANSFPGTFASRAFRSRERKFYGTFALWNFRFLELSLP